MSIQLFFDTVSDIRTLFKQPWLILVIAAVLVFPNSRVLAATIITYPVDLTKVVGQTATFGVRVSGTLPTSYEWSFNDVVVGTNSSVTINPVQASSEGFYYVHVWDANGDDYAAAQLTVITPPSIVTQPETNPPAIVDGDNYTFTVEAQGTDPLSYQWRRNNVNLADGTDASYYATQAGDYTVVVSNSGGSVTSTKATLVVWFPPIVSVQPVSRTNLAGTTATFTTTVTGTKPVAYQWLFNDVELPGKTTNSLSITNVGSDDEGNYTVHLSNVAGESSSEIATLTVLVPPKIVTQPVSQTINPGDDATFSVAVQDDATWPVVYHWRFNGIDITNDDDGPILYIPDAAIGDGGTYSVRITNPAIDTFNLSSVISTNVQLVVRRPPFITLQPVDTRVGYGTNVTLSIRATGTAPMTYQWLFNESPLSGATNSTFSFKPTNTNQSGLYSVFVSNIVDVVTSTPAALTVIGEAVLPTVTVTNPSLAFVTVTNANITIAGKAKDNFLLSKVLVQLNSQAYLQATGTAVWGTPVVLKPGTNIVHVKSMDSSGNLSVIATRTIFYSVKSPLTLLTNGLGTISALTATNLEIGRGYNVTAKPGVAQMFAGWTGTISSNPAALHFTMQSNMVLQANFVPDPYIARKGVYNGLFYQTNGVRQISSGSVTMSLLEKGVSSGKVVMGSTAYPFTNQFTASGTSTFDVLRLSLTPLTLRLSVDVVGTNDQISGSVSNRLWLSALIADRNVFSKSNANPRAGVYNVVIPGSSNPLMPAGDSYGVATLDTLGNVRLSGTLADGTLITQGTTVSKDGDWPLYVPLYTGKGVILSWVTLANTNDLAGDVTWFRPTNTSKFYPAGFTNLLSLDGGVFQNRPKGTRVLNLTNATVLLSGGNLPGTLTSSVVLNTNNTFTISSTNKLALTVNATNGVLTGSFIHPVTKLSTPIKGTLIQQQNVGHGFFLGTNQSGVFLLQAN